MVVEDLRIGVVSLWDDRMADGQQSEELADVGSVRVFGRQVLHHRRGHARAVDDDVVIGRVDGAAHRALLELHDVLR